MELKGTVSIEIYKECEKYIEHAKETRHNKVLQRQVSKFKRLYEKNSAKKSGHLNSAIVACTCIAADACINKNKSYQIYNMIRIPLTTTKRKGGS